MSATGRVEPDVREDIYDDFRFASGTEVVDFTRDRYTILKVEVEDTENEVFKSALDKGYKIIDEDGDVYTIEV